MVKQQFKTQINAPAAKVWQVLWNDDTYGKWTSVFSEGAEGTAKSDWKEGSEILFLGPGGGGGMYSVIEKRVDNQYMAFKHLGEIKDGVKQPASDWSGSIEAYTLKENNGQTELTVDMDITEEFSSFFGEIFPKALALVKQLSET